MDVKSALYALKQAPMTWYSRIDGYFLKKNGFVKCFYGYAIYIMIKKSGDTLIICLYVDNLIFLRNNPKMFGDFKQVMINYDTLQSIKVNALVY
jgi:hypothetical protein